MIASAGLIALLFGVKMVTKVVGVYSSIPFGDICQAQTVMHLTTGASTTPVVSKGRIEPGDMA